MSDWTRQRNLMVERQIAARGIRDPRVLDAMREVPRERFVPDHLREFAYEDSPLPIGEGQTISQPYIVAVMLESARIAAGDRVLEIGAGSGYAAAVMSRMAAQVYAIERLDALTEAARARLHGLGYRNISIRCGDGTEGWPEAAPFDAIVAAAGGPQIPDALREQLAIGGRLVIPVGDTPRQQRLVKLTRTGADAWEQEELGEVRFVPLIGAHGWSEDGRRPPADDPPAAQPQWLKALQVLLREAAEPLADPDDPTFAYPFERFAHARIVLLGEASHGTSEFYRARAAITQRLVKAHGFTIVALEADWPDAASLNRWVRGMPPRDGEEPPFQRFPTWMWRNAEVLAFLRWLREHNLAAGPPVQAGVYGLDLYNLDGSMRAVIDYLDRVDPEAANVARERYGCLTPWQNEPQTYGRLALSRGYAPCEQAVVAMLRELLGSRLEYAAHDGEAFLDASANARLVRDAEAYYRAMYYGTSESWNLRDTHMFETLCQLLEARGPGAKAVVWAHNSHIGDARYTEMGRVRAELNIGQLCRECFGADAALIGFGTHQGEVAAATDWDAPMRAMRVRPSHPDSYERIAHDTGLPRFLVDLRDGRHEALRERLLEPRLERYIGVVYRPETERWSHYSSASLPMQYDAWAWFDETTAVTPIAGPEREGPEETFPFGL